MVITNGTSTVANTGGAEVKPLLGSANTVQCQVRECGGEVPARISEHCSVQLIGTPLNYLSGPNQPKYENLFVQYKNTPQDFIIKTSMLCCSPH